MVALQRSLNSITDSETNQLIEEMFQVSGLPASEYQSKMLLHFFQQVMLSNGASNEPTPITKDELDRHDVLDSFVLRKTVGKTGDDLYSICADLAKYNQKHVDSFHGTRVYVFLSKMILQKVTRRKQRRLFGR